MPKTPDDVKKGLECCIKSTCEPCCPYGNAANCKFAINLLEDALVYIRRLEEENHRLANMIQDCSEKENILVETIEELEAERDAAVKEFANQFCEQCRWFYVDLSVKTRPCMKCDDCDLWEWRGVPKEG